MCSVSLSSRRSYHLSFYHPCLASLLLKWRSHSSWIACQPVKTEARLSYVCVSMSGFHCSQAIYCSPLMVSDGAQSWNDESLNTWECWWSFNFYSVSQSAVSIVLTHRRQPQHFTIVHHSWLSIAPLVVKFVRPWLLCWQRCWLRWRLHCCWLRPF